MPGGITELPAEIDADDLAWLALQPDVESRLILTDRSGEIPRYSVEHGPFDESRLTSLPNRDWTLLAHDVEKHLPALREWIAQISFVPDWRVDDVMVSAAAPGGSVGPHVDNYDVFLCQGGGVRCWQLESLDNTTPDSGADELSLLLPFSGAARYSAKEGDVLYLPPGQPHWGVADSLCVTYSIGMRAPSRDELSARLTQVSGDLAISGAVNLASGPDRLYSDPDLSAGEAQPGLISANTINRIRQQALLPDALSDEAISQVIGCYVTEPKDWIRPEGLTADEAENLLVGISKQDIFHVHGMARLAYTVGSTSRYAFANGASRAVSPQEHQAFERLCDKRKTTSHGFDKALLSWLLQAGVFDQDQLPTNRS